MRLLSRSFVVGLPRNPGPLSRTFRHGKVFLSLGTGDTYKKVGATGRRLNFLFVVWMHGEMM
jgi:hypothetical protein